MTSISQSGAKDLPGGGAVRPWLSGRDLALLGLVALGIVALFYRWMNKQFGKDGFSATYFEDWAHAWFVPVISAYYIWLRRREIMATPVSHFWPGLGVMLAGIVSYAFFVGGYNNHMFQGFSLVLVIAGAVLLVLGPAMLEKLFFPIAFLGFAVTISEMVMNVVTWPLKLIAAKGAWFLLNMVGVQTDLEGNVLIVGPDAIPLDVADACSGMRMVIAFLALGAAVAFFACRYWWQRAAIVMLALPVAVFMNVARVAVLGLLTLVNPELAKGQAHMMVGNLLLLPAFGVFMFFVWALNRAVRDEEDSKKAAPTQAAPSSRRPRPARLTPAPAIGAIAVLILSAGAFGAVISALKLHLTKSPIEPPGNLQLHTLPTEFAEYKDAQGNIQWRWRRRGDDQILPADVAKELGTQNYLSRLYLGADSAGKPVGLNIHFAYYTGMIDTVPHVPERCMVGHGWELTGESVIVDVPLDLARFPIDPNIDQSKHGTVRLARGYIGLPAGLEDLKMRVTRFVSSDGQEMYAGYFFFANGQNTPTADNVRLMAFRLTDDYAYYMKLQFSTYNASSPREFAAIVASFLDESLHEITRRIPDWVEVREGRYPAP